MPNIPPAGELGRSLPGMRFFAQLGELSDRPVKILKEPAA
jgi:hypothetical protein